MLNKNNVCIYKVLHAKSEIYSTENMYEKIYKTVGQSVVNKTDNVLVI